MLLGYSCTSLITLILRLTMKDTFYKRIFPYSISMARPFAELYYDQVVPRQQLLNPSINGVPFQNKMAAFVRPSSTKAIAYELQINFGQYYQF